jgi:hypothetical protein
MTEVFSTTDVVLYAVLARMCLLGDRVADPPPKEVIDSVRMNCRIVSISKEILRLRKHERGQFCFVFDHAQVVPLKVVVGKVPWLAPVPASGASNVAKLPSGLRRKP